MENEEFMRYISGLVMGMMSVILNSLATRPVYDYDTFKEAVLKRYWLGPDHFRKKFLTAAPQQVKSMATCVAHLWTSFLK